MVGNLNSPFRQPKSRRTPLDCLSLSRDSAQLRDVPFDFEMTDLDFEMTDLRTDRKKSIRSAN